MAASDQKLCSAVAQYGSKNVEGLKEGDVKYWCACGLSKNQPWCDGSHKGTGHSPLKWTVPKTEPIHKLCMCKHTSKPPYCDGTHRKLPSVVEERIKNCQNKSAHVADCRLCTGCGWVPDF